VSSVVDCGCCGGWIWFARGGGLNWNS
jgi:hypothetical protein